MNVGTHRLVTVTTALATFIGMVHAVTAGEAKSPGWTRTAVRLPESIWSVEAVDANADGKLDLIAMGETKVFALVAPDWKPHVLVDTKQPKMLYCVALDADAD